MTNAEIIQAIKAEIERRYNKHKYSTAITEMVYAEEDEQILSFLSTLEEKSEKPVPADLEEAADNHIREVADAAGHPGWDWTTQDIADAFIAGAKWQAEQLLKSSPLPEDTVLFNKGVEEGKKAMKEQMMKDGLDAVKSGQFNKIEKTIAGVFVKYGMDMQKQDMMKDAVEGIVMNFSSNEPKPTVIVDAKGFNQGDRVRVIVLPKED